MQNKKFLLILLALISIPQLAHSQFDLLGVEETTSETAIEQDVSAPENEEETPAATPETETKQTDDTSETEEETPVAASQLPTQDILYEYIDDVETGKKAKSSARHILESSPNILRLRENEIKAMHKSRQKSEALRSQINNIFPPQSATDASALEQNSGSFPFADNPNAQTSVENRKIELLKKQFTPAPLGLFWEASIAQTKELGFKLIPAARKDYKNVFLVENPQQSTNTFRQVSAIFGLQNRLWCIYAIGTLLDDDKRASNVLELYHQYYQALSIKYGNAQQFFTPYRYEQQLVEGEGNQKKVSVVQKENPIGGENFLAELQEGKAVLYATFHNEEIGVTLGVSVDGQGKSYISLDYKKLELMEQEQQEKLNTLIENL